MEHADIGKLLVHYARRAYDRHLVSGTGGNFSARLSADKIIITASGLSLADTTLENLITVDLHTLAWEPVADYRPSIELGFHVEILRRRADVGAVLHLHPPYATAYAVIKRDIPMVTDSAFKQPPLPRVPFAPSGSEALHENVGRVVAQNPGCRALLLEQHGIIALGSDVVDAYNQADLMEELARIAYLAEGLGDAPL